ncbi:MAG: OmpA family protein [Ignavibacteriales bacterium]|nr:OmpA family protein [Ignavibacteriales bacterium]
MVTEFVKSNPNNSLIIKGYSDGASSQRNLAKALERSMNVANHLISQGVSKNNLATQSFVSNSGNANNDRRVDFEIKMKGQ